MRGKLVESFGLATHRAATVRTCGALFVRLHANGIDHLRMTLYYPAPPEVVRARCADGAAAATNPGSAVTWLCPGFGSLPTQRAALVLIHEALHFAGMQESPPVAGAFTSAEINELVRDACGF